MFKYAILVRCVDLEAALSEHAYKGYTRFDDIHELFWPHFNDTLVAPALTMHGHVKIEVDEDFELASILESKGLQVSHLTLKLFRSIVAIDPRRFLSLVLLGFVPLVLLLGWLVRIRLGLVIGARSC